MILIIFNKFLNFFYSYNSPIVWHMFNDVITMAAGCKHTVIASEEGLQLIEVQLGQGISAADKHKYEMPL